MAKNNQGHRRPELLVNGARIDVIDPVIEQGGTDSEGKTAISFRIGSGGPSPLYFIGSQISLQVDDFGPSTFRVVGIDEDLEEQKLPYKIRLREVKPAPSFQDTLNLLYGTVFQTIMNRVRLHAIVDTLEESNLLSDAEYSSRMADIAERFLVQYASDIVSQSDAIAMRDYVVKQLRQGGVELHGSDTSQDG